VIGFVVRVVHRRGDRVLLVEEGHNLLMDEGEQAILSAYLATAYAGFGSPPGTIYLALDNRDTIAEEDTLSDLVDEPATNGYERQGLSTGGTGLFGQDWVISQPGAAYQAKSKQVQFSASGGSWGPVKNTNLCTVASGTGGLLLSSFAMSQSRIANDGEDITIDYTLVLREYVP
jgi:hypothetical protein